MPNSDIYGIIIPFILAMVISMTFLMFFTDKLKKDVKNSSILFLLTATSFFLMVTKEGYKPDNIDYIFLAFLAMYAISKIIERLFIDDKREKIFEEERKWKENTFGAHK